MNRLSTPLANWLKRKHLAVGLEVCLFGEFAPRGGEKIVARLYEAFWYCPGALVLFRPEWPAWMRKQDFDARLAAANYRRTFCPALAK
jgi:hypothetical protein